MDVMHIVWKPAQCDDIDVWAYVHGQQGTMSGCAAKKSILMSIIQSDKKFDVLKHVKSYASEQRV